MSYLEGIHNIPIDNDDEYLEEIMLNKRKWEGDEHCSKRRLWECEEQDDVTLSDISETSDQEVIYHAVDGDDDGDFFQQLLQDEELGLIVDRSEEDSPHYNGEDSLDDDSPDEPSVIMIKEKPFITGQSEGHKETELDNPGVIMTRENPFITGLKPAVRETEPESKHINEQEASCIKDIKKT